MLWLRRTREVCESNSMKLYPLPSSANAQSSKSVSWWLSKTPLMEHQRKGGGDSRGQRSRPLGRSPGDWAQMTWWIETPCCKQTADIAVGSWEVPRFSWKLTHLSLALLQSDPGSLYTAWSREALGMMCYVSLVVKEWPEMMNNSQNTNNPGTEMEFKDVRRMKASLVVQ